MAKRRKSRKNTKPKVEDYRHEDAKRKNNPPAKIAAEGVIPAMPKAQYAYNPHLPPVLRSDPAGEADQLPELLAEAKSRPLTDEEIKLLAEALKNHQPWLEWTGKREKQGFEVDPVALHIHERISAEAILKVAAREDIQRSLFADPQQEYHEAVQFYKHDIDWTNRMILGDSLQVMSSLAIREDLAGKVQMVYIDPPYGIKYRSNFQPFINKKDVKDNEQDLTRELEMVKAYRDTWHLGIHSYLAYMRDRLVSARELLSDTGSIFVQISEENIHRVRLLMDEVFGPGNFVSLITYRTKNMTFGGKYLETITDHLLWYAKDKSVMKYFQLFRPTDAQGDSHWNIAEFKNGERRQMNAEQVNNHKLLPEDMLDICQLGSLYPAGLNKSGVFPIRVFGCKYEPPIGKSWKTNEAGLQRVAKAERIEPYKGGETIRYVMKWNDYPVSTLSSLWHATPPASNKKYVVQTSNRVIEKCLLMATEPGDLVLDPTCGSGTTAYVAEEWGRRWITIDTSRVSIAIARQRLLTSKYEYYALKNEGIGITKGFIYKTVPHITLQSIANNTHLDPLFDKHEPILKQKLANCSEALKKITKATRQKLETKLYLKEKNEGKKSITDADRKRWNLPDKLFEHWTVPFDTDEDWPDELKSAVEDYRKAWSAKMDGVNSCIAANADHEELVNQPKAVRGIVRVSGPFTVEAVQPPEMSIGDAVARGDEGFAGEPEELETFGSDDPVYEMRMVESRAAQDVKNLESYLDQMLRLLKTDGVRFPNNRQMNFTRLEAITGRSAELHAEGRWVLDKQDDDDPEGTANVCVAFGPQYGPVTAKQVEDLVRSANRHGYDDLVIAGFSFDGPAQAVIEEAKHPKLRIHMANIRPDVNPGMEGLLKEQPGSQLFTVFGQPRTNLAGPDEKGQYTVEMEGVDIYNPVDNSIKSTGADKVAAWFIDGDYDGWTFCITQAFFPDKSAWGKLSKALKTVVDPERFEALSGTVSLPFPAGKHKRVAVKVIDPRGNEVMKVHAIGE